MKSIAICWQREAFEKNLANQGENNARPECDGNLDRRRQGGGEKEGTAGENEQVDKTGVTKKPIRSAIEDRTTFGTCEMRI